MFLLAPFAWEIMLFYLSLTFFNSLLKQGKRNGEKITPLIRFTRFNINTE